jgi:UDP-galactopyranose mutase
VSIYSYFEIRSTCFEERIVDIIVHNYGLLILRTDYSRLLAFTYAFEIM